MLTGDIAEMVKGLANLNDEELAKLQPGEEKLFRNVPKMMQYQTIAEVVKSERCFAQVKKGDKIVFDPYLNLEKSSGVMCPKAVLPVLVQINALWEMAAEWAESGKEDPPQIVFQNIRCMDPGLEDGGVGGVVYRIQMEKMGA